jgi:hypothetical protein
MDDDKDTDKDRKRFSDLHARMAGEAGEFQSARKLLLAALLKQQRSWSDLTQAIADGHLEAKGVGGIIISRESIYEFLPDAAATVLALHDHIGGDNAAEALAASAEIKDILKTANRSWIDLTNLLINGMEVSEPWKPNLLDELVALLNEFVTFQRQPHDAIASALWILHTYVYDQFQHTPRFATFSHDAQSGKSVLVTYMMGELARLPNKLIADKGIAASLYWLIDAEHPTILMDEAQNTEIVGTIKSIINGGFEKAMGGIPRRVLGGGASKYNLFGATCILLEQGQCYFSAGTRYLVPMYCARL